VRSRLFWDVTQCRLVSYLSKFRCNLSFPSSRVKQSPNSVISQALKEGPPSSRCSVFLRVLCVIQNGLKLIKVSPETKSSRQETLRLLVRRLVNLPTLTDFRSSGFIFLFAAWIGSLYRFFGTNNRSRLQKPSNSRKMDRLATQGSFRLIATLKSMHVEV
jgi:hypothetical protein